MRNEVRWKQRFENFSRAFKLLQEAFDRDPEGMSDLEKEGAIQRFEYTFELAWKTLMDYLIYSGVAFDQITPRSVIKEAFAAKVIKDGQVWIDMLEQRNLMSHTYDDESFRVAFNSIAELPGGHRAGVHMAEAEGTRVEESFGLRPQALELIRGVFHRHPQVRRVEVFGSRAMGRFENHSDVDLALWGDLDPRLLAQIIQELDDLPLPYTFDVKAYEAIGHEPLKRHIDEFGKTLYRSPAEASG